MAAWPPFIWAAKTCAHHWWWNPTGPAPNPSFAASSTTDLLVLNCGVKVVGDIPLTIKTTSGEVVYHHHHHGTQASGHFGHF